MQLTYLRLDSAPEDIGNPLEPEEGFSECPRIAALQATNAFIALPNVVNAWHRVGVGLSFCYDKFDFTDWATIDSNRPQGFNASTGVPRIDWLGGLMTDYGNRPDEGSRVCNRWVGGRRERGTRACAFPSRVVRPAGVEPATFGFGDQRSIQLSYGRALSV